MMGLLSRVAVVTWILASPLQAQTISEQFEEMQSAWLVATPGSPAESAAGTQLTAFLERVAGDDAIDAYREYLDAPVGSPEEDAALQRALQLTAAAAGVRESRAQAMLESYFSVEFYETLRAMGGAVEAEQVSEEATTTQLEEVELAVEPGVAVAGSGWSVAGMVRNNGASTVYLESSGATLEVNPPLSELASADGSATYLPAKFPPSHRRINRGEEEWIPVHSGTELRVVWEGSRESESRLDGFLTSIIGPAPGEYSAHVVAPISVGLPREGAPKIPLTQSVTVTVPHQIGAMLPWAWLGGLLVIVLQLAAGSREDFGGERAKPLEYVRGFLLMLALLTVVLFVSSALEGLSLLPHLSIESRQAAIASGMLIQLLGYSYFKPLLKKAPV